MYTNCSNKRLFFQIPSYIYSVCEIFASGNLRYAYNFQNIITKKKSRLHIFRCSYVQTTKLQTSFFFILLKTSTFHQLFLSIILTIIMLLRSRLVFWLPVQLVARTALRHSSTCEYNVLTESITEFSGRIFNGRGYRRPQ